MEAFDALYKCRCFAEDIAKVKGAMRTRNLRVLFDHQCFSYQRYGGISRYFAELIRSLGSTSEVHPMVPLGVASNAYVCWPRVPVLRSLLPCPDIPGRRRVITPINDASTKMWLSFGKFDVMHPTYYDDYFIDRLDGRPFVITVHDMIYEMLLEPTAFGNQLMERKARLVKKADAIIAVSHNTKADLLTIIGPAPEKIHVIHHAYEPVAPGISPAIETRLPYKYVLYVGARYSYKNFACFAKALVPLMRQDPELHLVCVGGGKFRPGQLAAFERDGCATRVHQFDVRDRNLDGFYSRAVLFAFPSLYEGFGFPILESFANRCPAAISNTSSFPEVAEDAAMYFDPTSEDSMRAAIGKLLRDEPLREQLVARGQQRYRDFSWRKAAEESTKVYRQLSEHS
jgi:glycosyltransferase involved in cell wall biosynthesis